MSNAWGLTSMKSGETLTFTIPVRSRTRTLFRAALHATRKRTGFDLVVKYHGQTITVTRRRTRRLKESE